MKKDVFECRDCLEALPALPDDSIHLTVTSPPYDSLRTYGGHVFSFNEVAALANELWRVTVPGGVVAWVVQDQIKDGTHSLTSFKHALQFEAAGFLVHNIITIEKKTSRGLGPRRYGGAPEFVFVFSKGSPRVANLIRDKPNRHAGKMMTFSTRDRNGELVRTEKKLISSHGRRGNVWRYATGGRQSTTTDPQAYHHPSLMPEALARDLVLSWSNPLDVVLDPLAGAGTTAVAALLNDRYYLGFEIHEPYHRLALERLEKAHEEYRRMLLE